MNELERRPGFLLTPGLRLEEPLVRGGMGVLWRAQHLALGLRVVVKFLADEVRHAPRAASRLAKEAGALAQVKSPHVVQVLDCGVSPAGDPYIVMEHLDGCDLALRLKEHGPLPPDEVVSVVRQLARALSRTHAAGFVHRDVKPSNVFLCDVGHDEPFVKLLDFGVAKSLLARSASTQSGAMVGTPAYMSPEQILAAEVDARTDIWGLGVLVFECLAGKRPFEGETTGALALSIHTLARPSLRDHAPHLNQEADRWFARACAVDPASRFASAVEAAEALGAALGREPSAVMRTFPVPSTESGVRAPVIVRAPRRRRVVAAAAVVGVASVVVGAVASWRSGALRPPPAPPTAFTESLDTTNAAVALTRPRPLSDVGFESAATVPSPPSSVPPPPPVAETRASSRAAPRPRPAIAPPPTVSPSATVAEPAPSTASPPASRPEFPNERR